jgi:hypothetical protein
MLWGAVLCDGGLRSPVKFLGMANGRPKYLSERRLRCQLFSHLTQRL